ncbi:hypothetical protein GCM10009836_53790 [Pseudonocardia ailaonensis]|uniref:SnoaL-like domain-containing protein n=1 Tax=Pseudonocardia ailaonensis TaxID=367279 RepID=A0ABN2NF65_9PSEU
MEPAVLVDRYLQLCERRELAAAGALLTDDARLVFPGAEGGTVHHDLPSVVAASAGLYRRVGKPERHYAVATGGGPTVVTCRGTLAGEWLDGSPFSGIRFVDVFVLDGDRIAEQHVYNDLALAAPARRPHPLESSR